MEFILGFMGENMKFLFFFIINFIYVFFLLLKRENGLIIICMEMEFIHGKMDGNMKDNISMIKNMVLEVMYGQMEGIILGIGHMESIFLIFILKNLYFICR